ncbi:MAG: PilZ domain-containing protein [Gemmataceae bacterium]|nr:PilZ domain-containing protein [Gemmataceae bacterium]
MSHDLIEQTEKRLAETESLQLTLKELQLELTAYRELLTQKLTLLRSEDDGTSEEAIPQRPAARTPEARPSRATAAAPVATAPTDAGEERRTAPRRRGNPVSVQVSDANARTEPFQGWVVDRSSGGLRLLVDQSVSAGTVLSVRPTKAHPSFPWVQVKVRSCRPERSSWNLGCQFVAKLSWAELQVFG